MSLHSPRRASSPSSHGIAVLVPALNEEEALPSLLRSIRELARAVVVVDNGSTDGTARVAAEHGATVVREERRGYGSACLAGLRRIEAWEPPPEVVVFVDADQSVREPDFDALVRPVVGDRADLVLGTRVDPAGGVGTLLPHARLGNRVVLFLARLLFGRRWKDLSPFRAIRTSSLRALEMDDPDWGWTLQMQIRAELRGLRTLEIDVPHHGRTRGVSKITGSLGTSVRVGLKMFYTLARERLLAASARSS